VSQGGQTPDPPKIPQESSRPKSSSSPAVVPVPPAEFAEQISDDLVVDAAESLKLIREPSTRDEDEDSDGIRLEDLGVPGVTQKIAIRAPIEDEDTVDEDTTVSREAIDVPEEE
jgi:hypothetical protein